MKMKDKRLGIGIIAPSNSMNYIDKSLISFGKKKLESLNFNVKIGHNAFKENGYNSSKIEERLKDINDFLDDDSIDVLMAAYGGYNCNELLPYLDYDKIKEKKKKFIGYSDTTAILNTIAERTGIITFLGPSFITFCDPNASDDTINSFLKVVIANENINLNEPDFFAYDDWYLKDGFGPRELKQHTGFKSIKKGTAEGQAVGGNLETLLALAGTNFFPSVVNKILFIEDLPNVNMGKFRRELIQLSQMNILNKVKGIVFGQFSEESTLNDELNLKLLVDGILGEINIPIISNVNVSHVSPIFTIPIGGKVRITSGEKCKIEILGGMQYERI
jgi:muramoyltetrapeptide carboxypeptidase LdcA involved in peptidoglycan recycling